MLMAVLYSGDDKVAAAAPACDQLLFGDEYWSDIHPGKLLTGPDFDTGYLYVQNTGLRNRLLSAGIDDQVCGIDLAREIQSNLRRELALNRAA